MSFVIKNANDLSDEFKCFCVFMKWCWEEGEDYIDYHDSIVNAYPFTMWLFGKGYITSDQAETIVNQSDMYLQDVLCGEVLFPNTYGEHNLGMIKRYSLLAEYMSNMYHFRNRIFDDITSNWESLEDVLIIDDDDACYHSHEKGYIIEELFSDDVSLMDLFNLAKSLTISECDAE